MKTVAVSPGNYIVSGGRDKTVKVWELLGIEWKKLEHKCSHWGVALLTLSEIYKKYPQDSLG